MRGARQIEKEVEVKERECQTELKLQKIKNKIYN